MMVFMDWKKLLSEISGAGLTQKEVADYCGCSQSTISELSRGEIKEPAHSLGEKLIECHATTKAAAERRTGKDRRKT
jgi:transcriptional regulator with XRE-family HTH domain